MSNDKRVAFTVAVSIKGQNGLMYEGRFEWYRRTIGDIPLIAAETARLMNGAPPVGTYGSLVQMMAELNVVTKAAPPWWDNDTLFDETILMSVFGRYADWRDSFLRPPKPAEDEDSGEDTGDSGGPGGEGP